MLKNDYLPAKSYTDPAYFTLEQEHIFSKTWAFAGLREDITKPGQFISVQAGLNNIIVIMDENHTLRAYHNICPHRGTQLLAPKGKVDKHITCPYHDWRFDLNGQLRSLPKKNIEFKDLDKKCFALKAASVELWRGMLWVHPEENPIKLSQWLGEIVDHIGPHDVEKLVEATNDVVVKDVAANWKIVIENYIDHYHLAQLHAGTLNMYDHAKANFQFFGPHFAFHEPLTKSYHDNIERNSPLPLIKHIEKADLAAWVPMLFPGIGLTASESSWSVFQVIPLAVDKTRIVIRTKIQPSSDLTYLSQSMRSAFYWRNLIFAKDATASDDHPLASEDFLAEDIYVCEQLQRSLTSPMYQQGPSALFGEAPVREYQRIVWQYIKAYSPEQ
ncbi:aromatic ring-hydroxylating oxygenase subunit alpha [Cognaticolwellia aestuarii]|uniref:aromatic ring-hydroxylating oxygenase subunit alpha n=1 Tax=Cognaticolwellia aestuarii TaxID=329993 RepID=UPI000986455C|nr:aromatic ring-hydroxylating dioxygenase subunit alpha [Cognaticolwellia aestuarii]